MIYLFGISSIVFLNSIVGNAGASYYVACMIIFGTPVEIIKPTAIILNVSISSLNSIRFLRDGHLDKNSYINFLIPILILSIPYSMLEDYLKFHLRYFKYFYRLSYFSR